MLDNADPRLGAAWHPVARSSQLDPTGTPVRLLGREWLVRKGFDGGSAVSTDGRPAHAAVERYGLVWVAVDPPLAPLPVLAEMDDPGFATAVIERATPVSAGVLTDNFLDVSHFSYLHTETFGRVAPVTTESCTVGRDGWRVELRHGTDLHEGAEVPEGSRAEDSPTWRLATYSVLAPYVTHLRMEFPATGSVSAATLVCQPEDADRTTVRVVIAWDATDPQGLQEQIALSEDVLSEDLRILERMADPRLALDLKAELHTRADRASVEYRRMIAEHLRTVDAAVAA